MRAASSPARREVPQPLRGESMRRATSGWSLALGGQPQNAVRSCRFEGVDLFKAFAPACIFETLQDVHYKMYALRKLKKRMLGLLVICSLSCKLIYYTTSE